MEKNKMNKTYKYIEIKPPSASKILISSSGQSVSRHFPLVNVPKDLKCSTGSLDHNNNNK